MAQEKETYLQVKAETVPSSLGDERVIVNLETIPKIRLSHVAYVS